MVLLFYSCRTTLFIIFLSNVVERSIESPDTGFAARGGIDLR